MNVLAEDDYRRRQSLLSMISSQQNAIRAQLTSSSMAITIAQRVALEGELEGLIQQANRVECMLHSNSARFVKKEMKLEHKSLGILFSKHDEEVMDLTSPDFDSTSETFKRQRDIDSSLLHSVKKLKSETPCTERVEIDLTLDSEDEMKPMVKDGQKCDQKHSSPPSRHVVSATPAPRSPTRDVFTPEPRALTNTVESEVEDVKPMVELDMIEPIYDGQPNMTGEERVRRLIFRVKREDEEGQFEMDESCKKCLGQDVVVPEGQRCFASREAIAHVFGGSHQDTYPIVSKDVNFERIRRKSWLICSNASYNPDMPRDPGQHGVMMSNCTASQPSAVFVCLTEHSWLYIGDYIVFGRTILPIPVWQQLPELTKTTWALNIASKDWGKSWMSDLPTSQRNPEGVRRAFDTGGLTMSISVLKCVGYDLDIVSAVGEAQKGWINGTVGSAKRFALGHSRKWLVRKGTAWLNETRAGQEWLNDDPSGQRFAQMTAIERQRWSTERAKQIHVRVSRRSAAALSTASSTSKRRITRQRRRSLSFDSASSSQSGSRYPKRSTLEHDRNHHSQATDSDDYEPSDLD